VKFGVDGRYLSDRIASGVPRYVHEICLNLEQAIPEATFIVYTQDAKGWTPPSARWVMRDEPIEFFRRIKPNLWLKLRMGALCERDGLDVFWSGCGLLPRLSRKILACMTIQDINQVLVPETMSWGNRLSVSAFIAGDLRRADIVFAGSYGTAQRVKHHYGRKADAVVQSSVSPTFRPIPPPEYQPVLIRHGLTQKYMMTVGVSEPRKNLSRLFDAIEELHSEDRLGGRRVAMIGRPGWKNKAVRERIERFSKTWLLPLGFVEDADLASLYSGTDLFLFPSIYEGFGIPALEARSCGALVMATDIPEIREAAGDDAVYSEGPDVPALKSAILAGLARADARDDSRNPEPVKWPTWGDGANTMAAAIRARLRPA